MEKSEEELEKIEKDTQPLLEEARKKGNRRFSSSIDTIILGLSIALGLDSIAVPILTGTTIHEYFGIPLKSNHEVYPGVTAIMFEQGIWTLSMFYNTARTLYKNKTE